MTYRDNHEAAVARIDALEKELAESRKEVAAATAMLARSERERAQLSAELERDRKRRTSEAEHQSRSILPVDADRVPSGRRLQPVDPKFAVALAAMVLLGLLAGMVRAFA